MSNIRNYPAIARKFPELRALQAMPTTEANTIRTEAYKSLYNKLSSEERSLANGGIKRLSTIRGMGRDSAWELLVAIAQAMEWADWPERE